MDVISVKGVTKVYKALDFWKKDKVTAVSGVNLTVKKGEVFGLLGLNGAGKTTLMKILLGLLKPTAGEALVLGAPAFDTAIKSRIGYLSELPYFPKYLKSREVLSYFADIFGIPQKQKKKRIEDVLELTGLNTRADVRIKGFSKGMQGRLGLAQAILNDPDLLFLDEPMSGLDPLGYKETRDIILELNRRGKTVFFNTHILSEVEKTCDRVAVLHAGRIVSVKAVNDVMKKYGSMEKYFVKTVTGSAA